MAEWNITFETHPLMIDMLDKCIAWLQERDASAIGRGSVTSGRGGLGLERFRGVLNTIFKDKESALALAAHYNMVVHEATSRRSGFGGAERKAVRTLSFWCMTPGVAMQELQRQGIRSFIVTSGTLAPMSSYASELQLPFPIQLENTHVIHNSQVLLRILERGPTGRGLTSAYGQRDLPDYKEELGKTVVNVCRIVPHGVLVFFPSFSALRSAVEHWQVANGGALWGALTREKTVVVEGGSKSQHRSGDPAEPHKPSQALHSGQEPRSVARPTAPQTQKTHGKFMTVLSDRTGGFGTANGRAGSGPRTRVIGRGDSMLPALPAPTPASADDPFLSAINHFNETAGVGRGAVLLAVCRGRASEGIDFSDAKARAVILTGIPYPPVFDPKVAVKRAHLDAKAAAPQTQLKKGQRPLSGREWYSQQAARAVNQAVGRVIRHKHDYGAIILADSRFAALSGPSSARTQLSKWLQPFIATAAKYAELPRALSQFFRRNSRAAELRAPTAAPKAAAVRHGRGDDPPAPLSASLMLELGLSDARPPPEANKTSAAAVVCSSTPSLAERFRATAAPQGASPRLTRAPTQAARPAPPGESGKRARGLMDLYSSASRSSARPMLSASDTASATSSFLGSLVHAGGARATEGSEASLPQQLHSMPTHSAPQSSGGGSKQSFVQAVRVALDGSTVLVGEKSLKSYSLFRDGLKAMRGAENPEGFIAGLKNVIRAFHAVAGGTCGTPPTVPLVQRLKLLSQLHGMLPDIHKAAATQLINRLTGQGGVLQAIGGHKRPRTHGEP